MAARRSRTSVRTSQRRKLVWATFDNAITALGSGLGTNVNLLAALGVAGSSLTGCTIMRTHLRIRIPFDTTTSSVYLGLVLGRSSDVGTADPDPFVNPEIDWMYVNRFLPSSSGATFNATQVFDLDVRSKRRMQELGQAYLLSLRNVNGIAETFQIYARTLVALP